MFPFNYLTFLLKSQNQHGLHSPFVYDLVTKCFYDKKKYKEYKFLKAFRRDLLRNGEEIKVTDFGAGSKIFKSEYRKVKDIARHVSISEKRARFLFRLVSYLKCSNALELGTSVGIGTSALAVNKRTKVTTIEGCPQTAKLAQQQFQKFGLDDIELKVGRFEEVLEGVLGPKEKKEEREKRKETRNKRQETGGERQEPGDKKQEIRNLNPETNNNGNRQPRIEDLHSGIDNPQRATHNSRPKTDNSETPHDKQQTAETGFDLIYFDGNHQKEATLKYFEQLLPAAHNDSVFVFDDIHWSQGMEEAWESIKNHPEVQVTIDTFFLGLVFFRREQAKQHFRIRL